MISPSSIDPTTITLGKFDLARKTALFVKDSKNAIAHDSFKIDNKSVTIKFQAVTSSDQILVSKYGVSLPITIEDEKDLEGIVAFSEFIPSYLEKHDLPDWETTGIVKEDDKIFLKLKFDSNKHPLFKSNIPVSMKKPGDTTIHNDQKVEVTATLKFYFNFEDEKAGALLNLTHLNFEIDEDDVIDAPPVKRVKKE
jgi:hypothetical protein